MIIQYCSSGTLKQKIYSDDKLKNDDKNYEIRMKLIEGMLSGLNYLHLNKPIILHCDIKS